MADLFETPYRAQNAFALGAIDFTSIWRPS